MVVRGEARVAEEEERLVDYSAPFDAAPADDDEYSGKHGAGHESSAKWREEEDELMGREWKGGWRTHRTTRRGADIVPNVRSWGSISQQQLLKPRRMKRKEKPTPIPKCEMRCSTTLVLTTIVFILGFPSTSFFSSSSTSIIFVSQSASVCTGA